MYSINRPNNTQNEIEKIKKEIDLLQDRLKKNEKSQNQFKNELMHIGRIRVNKNKELSFSKQKNTKYS